MTDLGTVTGNILPAVTRAAVRPRCHMDLCRRSQPAHIAYIGRTCLKRIFLVQRRQERVHGMAAGLLHSGNLLPRSFIMFCCNARNPVISHIGFAQRIGKGILLIGIRRHAQLFIVTVKHTL